MKKKLFLISKTGFTICAVFLAVLVLYTNIQRKEIIVIPEFFGIIFLLILLVTMVSFIIGLVLDMIEEVKANRWSTVLSNIGLLGIVVIVMYLWDTRLLSVPINIVPWLCKTLISTCAVEAGAYILSRKIT